MTNRSSSRVRSFLLIFLIIGVVGSGSCGVEDEVAPTDRHFSRCDIVSRANAQRGSAREDYYPKVFAECKYGREDLGFPAELSEDYYDTAEKVSRSVFRVELIENPATCSPEETLYHFAAGTGWLIGPRRVVTAAHGVLKDDDQCQNPKMYDAATICVRTFDGEIIKAEVVYIHPEYTRTKCGAQYDLAVLELEREVDAVPMKIARSGPERNEVLMTMGHDGEKSGGLGSWRVTAGPALGSAHGLIYHASPTGGGMSGGPVFNKKGEVVSILSEAGNPIGGNLDEHFGLERCPSRQATDTEKLNLWVYGFYQLKASSTVSLGPSPSELRKLYDRLDLEEPANAGQYRDGNRWNRSDHPFGDNYSPFPVDQFVI